MKGSGINNWRSGIHRRLHHPGFKGDGRTLCNIPSAGLDLSEEAGEEVQGPAPINWCRRCWYLRDWARRMAREEVAAMASRGPTLPQDATLEPPSIDPAGTEEDAT